jgi:hypothetical protein
LFDCEFLSKQAFHDYVDFYVREHKLGTFELRWNITVLREWTNEQYLGTQVVRQRPLDRRALAEKEKSYLSVKEHLSIFFEAAKTAREEMKNEGRHWFEGVAVTLTHPRSSWMWKDPQQHKDKPDSFPVTTGLGFLSLEAFLDAVDHLHSHFKPLGHLIGGIDFVVRDCLPICHELN